MAEKGRRYELVPDRRGMMWDLLLYVPVVGALLLIGVRMSYGPQAGWAYVAVFLASLFFLIGANRVLKTRLMILPGSPVAFEIDRDRITLHLKNGGQSVLVKDLRFFSEIGGKTFALTGMDLSGQRQQYIFHAGQFSSQNDFNSAKALLDVYR